MIIYNKLVNEILMKILVIAPTPFFADRGTHIRILEEALALERRGYKITIATYHIGRDISAEVDTKIEIRRIRRLLFWYKKLEAGPDWQKIILDIMLIRKVFNLARTQRPDIIHAHLHEGVLIGWLVKKILFWRNIKLVADFHGSLTKEMVSHGYLGAGFLKKIFTFVEKIVDNMGDSAVTSSWENTEEIRKLRKDKKVETILDGVNLGYYGKLPSKESLRRELELPEDKLIISYTGALIMNKGIQNFLEAIPLVLKETEKVFFVIAGFPVGGVMGFIKEHGLEKYVRVISPLNYFELPKILVASDVGVDPKDSSTRQASGKILQYMAAGIPVVCFDRENNRKYLDQGAVYASAEGADGIAQAILDCVRNQEYASNKGIINKKSAEAFSWDASAQKMEKIYAEKQ